MMINPVIVMVKAIFQKTKVAPGGTSAVLFPRIEFSSKHTFMLPPGATLNENEPKKSSDSNGSDEVAAQITGGSTSSNWQEQVDRSHSSDSGGQLKIQQPDIRQTLRGLFDENDMSHITDIDEWPDEEVLEQINRLEGGQ